MHPILFSIGSFHLPTYGVLLASALLAALYTVVRLGRREGLDTARLMDLSTWIIVVSLSGAKVLMVVTDWSDYHSLGDVFSWATIQAGGVFYGGFLAAVLFSAWYVRAYRLPTWKVFDVYAPAIALGQSIGRLGCFAAGCDYGKPAHSSLAVIFTNPYSHDLVGVPLGIPLHPTQVYESLATLAIFGFLIWWFPRKTRDGEVFLIYLALYAVARFFLEFLRGDEDRGFVFHHLLSTSQFIALLALVAAAGLAYFFYGRRGVAPVPHAAPAPAAPSLRSGQVLKGGAAAKVPAATTTAVLKGGAARLAKRSRG
ncbi:MAG TPA: prolipoprotein diacylglyceryl transferase [Terriglobia bacterium]|nr:prolipoprotein diacylglyceryl transferase [Terriglobia bacterium]